jgi:hypothetical protein
MENANEFISALYVILEFNCINRRHNVTTLFTDGYKTVPETWNTDTVDQSENPTLKLLDVLS